MEKFENARIKSIGVKNAVVEDNVVMGKATIGFTITYGKQSIDGWLRKSAFMHYCFELLADDVNDLLVDANVNDEVFTTDNVSRVFKSAHGTFVVEHYAKGESIVFGDGEQVITLDHPIDIWEIMALDIDEKGVKRLKRLILEDEINEEIMFRMKSLTRIGVEIDDATKKEITNVVRDRYEKKLEALE